MNTPSLFPTLLALLLAAPSPCLQAQSTGEEEHTRALAERLDAVARPFAEAGLLSGSLAVGYRGRVVHRASWGMASYELAAPNGPETRSCVASLSKPITALAVARLVAEGELYLEDPVETWIEGMPGGDRMTLLHLLKHSAGVPHRVTLTGETTVPMTAADVVERVKRSALLFEPGTDTRYSTAGYSVVARILEIVTGEDYDAAMRRLVFEPLGMDATCHVTSVEVLAGRAQCYARVPEGLENAPLSDLSFLVGGGSLYSTATDLVRFGTACLRREGMPDGTWDVFASELGWLPTGSAAWNGKTSQFGAFLDLHPSRDLVVAFTGNIGVAGGASLRSAVPELFTGGDPRPRAFSDQRFDAEEAAPYLGSYVRDDGVRTTVVLDAGYLSPGGGMLVPMADGIFFSPTYGCDVTFDRDEEGRVTALVYLPGGTDRMVFRKDG